MQLNIFRGAGRIFGLTQDPAGTNLPTQPGPWTHFKTIDLHRGHSTPGVNADECLDDIEAHGFHITEAHIRITDRFL